jgi:hypothetical protein
MYNIVLKPSLINELKRSRHFRQNLGLVSTIEKNGSRVYNDKDKFSHFYNTRYNTTIYMQGSVGDIIFYIDYYIHDDVMAVYYNMEEFIFNFDFNIVKEKGIDFYLGHILKTLETEYEDRLKKAEESKIETKNKGNADLIIKNPGNVTYEDLKEFLDKKNKNRYSV